MTNSSARGILVSGEETTSTPSHLVQGWSSLPPQNQRQQEPRPIKSFRKPLPVWPTNHTYAQPDRTRRFPSGVVPISTNVPTHLSGRSPGQNIINSARSWAHPYSPSLRSTSISQMANQEASSSAGSSMNSPPRPDRPLSGMQPSPRRRKAPSFPSSPRTIRDSYNEPDGSPTSPLGNILTPSILRVPPSPISPTSAIGPNGLPQFYYNAPVAGHLTSNIREDRSGQGESQVGRATSPLRDPCKTKRGNPTTGEKGLDAIPQAYVLKSLNGLAAHFWNNAASSDCRICGYQAGKVGGCAI